MARKPQFSAAPPAESPGEERPDADLLALVVVREQGALAAGLPTVEVQSVELAAGLGVLSAFVKAGLVKSNGEARRQIQGGGLRVNDEPVASDAAKLTPGELRDGVIKLSLGRKRHAPRGSQRGRGVYTAGPPPAAMDGQGDDMATYVLVHGAYQGGWIWKPVA